MNDADLSTAVVSEVAEADRKYGPFTSTHEGLGVLLEEVAELTDAIRANDGDAIKVEAIQVSAVAYRIAACLSDPATRKRSGLK